MSGGRSGAASGRSASSGPTHRRLPRHVTLEVERSPIRGAAPGAVLAYDGQAGTVGGSRPGIGRARSHLRRRGNSSSLLRAERA
jgi:hypothetical protein